MLADHKCQELWYLLRQVRGAERAPTTQDTIRYRREAEGHVGSDEKLYRLDWVRGRKRADGDAKGVADGILGCGQDATEKKLRMQLMGPEDPTVDEDESCEGRWRGYVASYVMVHASEWVPSASSCGPAFLKRCVLYKYRRERVCGLGAGNADRTTIIRNVQDGGEEGVRDGVVRETRGLGVQIRRGSYKLAYEAGTEDALWRTRGRERARWLGERAGLREEERRRLFSRVLSR